MFLHLVPLYLTSFPLFFSASMRTSEPLSDSIQTSFFGRSISNISTDGTNNSYFIRKLLVCVLTASNLRPSPTHKDRKQKQIISVRSFWMIGLFMHVCPIVHVDFDQDPLTRPRQWDWCETGSVCAHFKESAKWNFLDDRKAPQHRVMRTLTPAFNRHKPFTGESLKFFYYSHSGWILLKVNDPHRFNKKFLPHFSPSKVRFLLQSAHVTQDFTPAGAC